MYLWGYGNGDEGDYEEGRVGVDAIERCRRRFQVLLTSKVKGVVVVKKIKYVGLVELWIMQKVLRELWGFPFGLVIDFLRWFVESRG